MHIGLRLVQKKKADEKLLARKHEELLKLAIRGIEKMPDEKRLFGQDHCLQQLAPLTNK